MAQPGPRKDWLPYVGFLLSVGGIIYQGGQLTARVAQNEREIATLKSDGSRVQTLINDMNLRSAKNEAKLDFLVDTAREAEQRRTGR